MTRLTLDLPDDLAARLADEARRRGRTVEEQARDALTAAVPAPKVPRESKQEILQRMRERWKDIPSITLTPEEMKAWINEGRP